MEQHVRCHETSFILQIAHKTVANDNTPVHSMSDHIPPSKVIGSIRIGDRMVISGAPF